jgi:hypothetical protein
MSNPSTARSGDYGAIIQRMTNMESRQSELALEIKSLAQEIKNQNKPQWATLTGFFMAILAVCGMVGALSLQPRDKEIAQNSAAILALSSEVKDSFRDLNQERLTYRQGYDRRFEDINRSLKDGFTEVAKQIVPRDELLERWRAVERDIEAIQRGLVPRQELVERWRANEVNFTALQRQVDELRAVIANVYSPRDFNLNIQDRITRLEREIVEAKGRHERPQN